MKRVRYQVAMSLDGYIGAPNGDLDWIPQDPDIDFAELFDQFDTVLVGRRTFEPMAESGQAAMFSKMKTVVFSSTLRKQDHPGVTLVNEGWEQKVSELRNDSGKDIWLFGGGVLFQRLLSARLVDTIELAIVPVVLGGGTPMAPPPIARQRLAFTGEKVFSKTGIVLLKYNVIHNES